MLKLILLASGWRAVFKAVQSRSKPGNPAVRVLEIFIDSSLVS
ncbi:MAG: hypothetical protein PHG48_01710 [Eubacteriales bacterium]|nr:hypothetical protein [Eubacteriales bacterium]